jgi:hypothetical protein
VNFARKLRDVVASNFIEIARTDEDAAGSREQHPRPAGLESPTAPEQPAPVIPAREVSIPKATWAEQDLTGFVGADGAVDFDRVLAGANLPRLGFTAEQVAKVLAALPNDLPMHVKRLTVRATLEAADREIVIDPQDVVADAMLKKVHVAQYRDALRAYVETVRRENGAEIERLQAEIERLKGASEAAEQKRRAADIACGERMTLMEQVVVFFQTEAPPVQTASGVDDIEDGDDEELPPFMREDAVFRMLGLDPAPADAGASDGDEAVPTAGKARKGSGRFAVAHNVEAYQRHQPEHAKTGAARLGGAGFFIVR